MDFIQQMVGVAEGFFFFNVDHVLSLYPICYNIVSVLCFCFFGPEACRILLPQPEMEQAKKKKSTKNMVFRQLEFSKVLTGDILFGGGEIIETRRLSNQTQICHQERR